MKLKFFAFRAIDEPKFCEQFLEGHVKVLNDYGITNITSNNKRWSEIPSIYVVVAMTQDNPHIVGGIRIQMADGIEMLPVEKAVGSMDPKIHAIVNNYRKQGVGELCALWNAKEVAGIGISMLLTRAGISIANQINCNILMGICSDYTMQMFTRVGFVVDKTLGNKGDFFYPKEDFIARVLGILNAENLAEAADYDRDKMLSLREHPNQTVIELGPKGNSIEIEYQLLLSIKS